MATQRSRVLRAFTTVVIESQRAAQSPGHPVYIDMPGFTRRPFI